MPNGPAGPFRTLTFLEVEISRRRPITFHAARCVACHGVRFHPAPVALVGIRH
jgi:hypothetical protein